MKMKHGYLIALMAGTMVVGGCNTQAGVIQEENEEAVVPPGAIPADQNASLIHPTVPKDQPTTSAAPAAAADSAGMAADSTPASAADSSRAAG